MMLMCVRRGQRVSDRSISSPVLLLARTPTSLTQMDIEQPPSGEDLPQATAHVDEESKDVGDGDGDAESSSSSAQGGRRKFNKYHNIRAHANPLSDNRFPGT